MPIFDPRLQFIQMQSRSRLRRRMSTAMEADSALRFGVEVAAPEPFVRVLLHFEGSLAAAEEAGLQVTSVAGDIAAGVVRLSDLEKLSHVEAVTYIESSRPLHHELDASIQETGADTIWSAAGGNRGAGVIVGVIDSGVDYRHESFMKPGGGTRILAIWDQKLAPSATEKSPAGFTYGVEYTSADIDTALATTAPLGLVRHTDSSAAGHGTHIAGIAAGNGGSAGKFVGMAPDADIAVVASNMATNFGDSSTTVDAINYLFDKGTTLGKAVVINISQGDNLGPHDGTSLLERAIDNLLGKAGRSIVKSAGNAGADNIHSSGTAPAFGRLSLPFQVPPGDSTPDTIDIWYSGAARLEVTFVTPSGAISASVAAPGSVMVNLPNGNAAFVASSTLYPFNSDNRIYVQLLPGTLFVIEAGSWELQLRETAGHDAEVDAWIESGRPIPSFAAPSCTRNGTITVPGTAKKIITVGAYATRAAAGVGDMCDFSSWGPRRRGAASPDLTAPGKEIFSAEANGAGNNTYVKQAGTSMAAPHVTGAIALLLAEDSSLTQQDLRDHLVATARTDAFTGTPAGLGWGAGKLDVHAAWQRVKAVKGV